MCHKMLEKRKIAHDIMIMQIATNQLWQYADVIAPITVNMWRVRFNRFTNRAIRYGSMLLGMVITISPVILGSVL